MMSRGVCFPHEYDEISYKQQIYSNAMISETIVFDGIFSPTIEGGDQGAMYFVACNNFGQIAVWNMALYMTKEYWEDKSDSSKKPKPDLLFQAHENQIYTLTFAGDSSNPLLISGADEDIRIWRWSNILKALLNNEKLPVIPFEKSLHHQQGQGIRGAMMPLSETNDICIDSQRQHIFAAAGDGIAYEWDLSSGQCVRSFAGHKGYLHSARYLDRSEQLVTGSEDGTVGVWDVRSCTALSFLSPCGELPCIKGESTTGHRNEKENNLWIGAVEVGKGQEWMVCGGGRKRRGGDFSGTGHLSVWHLPSMTCTMAQNTPSDILDVQFVENEILSVGNESCMRYWLRGTGKCRASVAVTAPSLYFATRQADTQIIATGGSSPYIDIYPISGIHGYSLLFG